MGIIPARAGFTRSPALTSPVPRDHPRSRGVYPISLYQKCLLIGSSPLARGLPRRGRPGLCDRGIIPARAGFTSAALRSTSPRPDHPRSRGVYANDKGPSQSSEGSSPLARGLQSKRCASHFAGRIIPARAGFTVGSQAGTGRNGDHPRSRGVYWPAALDAAGVIGSSPLARGLLRHKRCPQHATPDHPRSRGVYQCPPRSLTRRIGSSPLARGLRYNPLSEFKRGGIIPARAGFTDGC